MTRLFPEHHIRKVQSLSGAWSFLIDPQDLGIKENWFAGLTDGETVIVPSVWNNESHLLNYEGVAWYEKRFYTKGGCLRFCFDAVMTEATVWLDGELLGEHYGGFTAFEFIVPDVDEGEHILTVRVDNRFDAHSIPQKKVDWYHYGGITRDVSVETLEGICVLSYRMDYTLSDNITSLTGVVSVDCYNSNVHNSEEKLTVMIGDTCVYDEIVEISGSSYQTIVLPEFSLNDIRLWDVGKPELYDVVFKTECDDLRDRVGFRKIETANGKILLNGKSVEIRGVNRHEEHADFGMAFPIARMKHDIDLIKDLSCNAIRGAHYPNSKAFLDFLDEQGIMFWSEIPIWGVGFSEEALADPIVVSRGLEMHKEMVKQYFNHPSIIMWGMHNEIFAYTQAAYDMSKLYYSYLKKNGGNRLVVYAACHVMTDICLEFSDVLCINLYYGWYNGGLETWQPELDAFRERCKTLGIDDRPVIMSEFGAAALYGFHDTECTKWSEEFQADLLKFCLTLFHERSEMVGSFVWQFCDVRACGEMGLTRARGYNNKGILNENRRPKTAYYTVKECYSAFASEKLAAQENIEEQ